MSGRPIIALLGGLGVAALAGPLALRPSPLWLWNASASAPIGLYIVHPVHKLAVGDWVAVRPAESLARMFAARGYLPLGVPLVKQVAAASPAWVCRWAARITVDGQFAVAARDVDRLGRPLPKWHGCRRLQANQVFLLNAVPDSLDSRYFGPSTRSAVIGRLTPLWTDAGTRR